MVTSFPDALLTCKLSSIVVLFVETPRKFITAKLSIRKPGSSKHTKNLFLSSIDFQKNLERQFYKDITNTRNAKIVYVFIVHSCNVFIVQSCQLPSVLVSKPVKWTILYSHIVLNTYQNMYH
jgi:hypothetical protein